jgi:2-dehydropantoate 2-reductase
MEDDAAEPPRLYAWTLENLSSEETGLTDVSKTVDDARRRIYILGVGNIGRLYAMYLSKLANRPPITLVVHRRELLEHWAAEPGIELTRHGQVHRSADFDIEWWTETKPPIDSGEAEAEAKAEVASGRKINNIIIATKASDAMPQVDRLRRYLGPESTVAFAQNGMCKLWPPLGETYVRTRFPDEGTSPNWIACVTTHGVYSVGPFKSVHAAPATALVGPVMISAAARGEGEDAGDEKPDEPEGPAYLMRQIAEAPDLEARRVSKKELWIAQLEKLVVNVVINPLTAVLRCKNGVIFAHPREGDDKLPVVIDNLLREASATLCALIADPKSDDILLSGGAASSAEEDSPASKPTGESLQAIREQLLDRFSFPRLRKMVLDVGEKVAENTSSMAQDMLGGKKTEIDDMNGWLVDTAKILDEGLRLPTHEKLVELVKARAELTRDELCARLLSRS